MCALEEALRDRSERVYLIKTILYAIVFGVLLAMVVGLNSVELSDLLSFVFAPLGGKNGG